MPLAFFENIGTTELIVILIVALLIFGHKLPSVMRGAGRSLGEFKKGVKESQDELATMEDENGKRAAPRGPHAAAPVAPPPAQIAAGSSGTPSPASQNTCAPKEGEQPKK